MRDFLPEELAKRRFVENHIRRVFEEHGFFPIETPAIEDLSTLLGKYGDEGDQLLFRILHRRDRLSRALESGRPEEKDLGDMGLRYDLTVPLARLVANYGNLPKFFKRYQIQPVWRADRPGKGRFREFFQCDVDITGTKSILAEAEVCGAVAKVIRGLGFTDFQVHINHRKLLRCLISHVGLEKSLEETVLVAVDKLDKIGEEGVLKELEKREIPLEKARLLLEILTPPAENDENAEISRLSGIFRDDPVANDALNELREIFALTKETFLARHLRLDASLARGLGYYTGLIFEIRVPDLKGSLGGGGRYDGLIGMFCGREIPAVGFSIGFERLLLLMEEKKLFPEVFSQADVLICRFSDVPGQEVVKIAEILRTDGLRVDVFPETPKIGKQIGYAESMKVPVVVILGSTELEENSVTIKYLLTGSQDKVPIAQAGKKILTLLGR